MSEWLAAAPRPCPAHPTHPCSVQSRGTLPGVTLRDPLSAERNPPSARCSLSFRCSVARCVRGGAVRALLLPAVLPRLGGVVEPTGSGVCADRQPVGWAAQTARGMDGQHRQPVGWAAQTAPGMDGQQRLCRQTADGQQRLCSPVPQPSSPLAVPPAPGASRWCWVCEHRPRLCPAAPEGKPGHGSVVLWF